VTHSEKTISQMLEQWDELREQGTEVSAEDLCHGCREKVAELRQRIEQLKAMDWLDESPDWVLQNGDGLTPPIPAPLLQHSAEGLNDSDSASIVETSAEPRMGQAVVPAVLGQRYEMESLMAEGGFAQVWRATDRALQRPVAIKVTTVNCYTEARRVAQLKHQGIVTVHDVGDEDGLCYIVFDLVPGSTLADVIRRGQFSWQQSVRLIAEVTESVQFAHNKGFIHRDLKPDNILLNENGEPVLADFGIAVTECELQRDIVTSVGTLAYMAPEQLQPDGQIDVRTDVYALGVVLYELLTGKRPYTSTNLSGLRDAILAGNPGPPSQWNPTIPPACEDICLKAMARHQGDRFSTAIDLASALRTL